MRLIDLIDKASKNAGNDYRLAKQIGVASGLISDWRNDRKPCSPENYALMAAAAGLDPEEALIRATLEKHAGSPKGDRLMKALGKGLHQIGVGALLAIFAATFGLLTPTRSEAKVDNVYYVNCMICMCPLVAPFGL